MLKGEEVKTVMKAKLVVMKTYMMALTVAGGNCSEVKFKKMNGNDAAVQGYRKMSKKERRDGISEARKVGGS